MTHPNPYTDVPTSDFDPYITEVLANPYPHYEQLRELGTWAWLERYGVLAVARHAEVQRILSQPDVFCSSAGVGLANFHTETPWRKPSIILEADPPHHSRTRKVVARVLSPASIGRLRATFEDVAARMVDSLVERGSFDAAKDLCEAFPIKAFGDAVGLPAEGREHLLPYGDMVFNGFGPINERFQARMDSSGEAVNWIAQVCQRDALTKDGLGAQLFAAADAGEIGHDEAGMLVRTLLSAGLDTTVFTLCNAITCFARHPEQWALLREDPSLARQALEEVLRFDSTFHSFYRTSTQDVELGGIIVKAGQKIVVFIASANRDPRRWPNADRFDITRRATGHMAFGTGIHGCAGQMMARLEGEIVLTALARRVASFRLDGEPVQHFNNTVRGLKHMPVTVEPLLAAVD
ncbi:MAG: cytochrome P450 [Hydrogenophaga sp.]|uniref:cytochrome P450 n=1 Tax=Hydrogenophaga sp. TaxID=1904254 RepID=UPI002613884A|nr:cytochrome P450 [Hydrogenophaga sp.]MDM7941241.1 cytochrome P450 [Hydrogenophaga sp.]